MLIINVSQQRISMNRQERDTSQHEPILHVYRSGEERMGVLCSGVSIRGPSRLMDLGVSAHIEVDDGVPVETFVKAEGGQLRLLRRF